MSGNIWDGSYTRRDDGVSLNDIITKDLQDALDFSKSYGQAAVTSLADIPQALLDLGSYSQGLDPVPTGVSKESAEKALGLSTPQSDAAKLGDQLGSLLGIPGEQVLKTLGVSKAMLIGVKGIQGLRDARGVEGLEKATTGIAKDSLSGKLATEISDKDASFKLPSDFREAIRQYRAGDILNHPDLFDAYPALKNTPVAFRNLPNANGSYNPITNRITLSNKRSEDDMLSTLIHELQHNVQDIEGWQGGSSLAAELLDMGHNPDIYDKLIKAHSIINNRDLYPKEFVDSAQKEYKEYYPSVQEAVNRYLGNIGEMQARNSQSRRLMSLQERKDLPYNSTYKKD